MTSSQGTRDWVKQMRNQGAASRASFAGLGVGINIRKRGNSFLLNMSVGAESHDSVHEDEFEMLEAIQAAVEEMYGE